MGFKIAKVAFLLTLVGCTSITPVTSLGGGKYMLGYQRRGGLDSWTEVKSNAIAEANKYCAINDKNAELIDTDEQGARGWTPMNVEVTFRCIDR
jgi:hypothetical protein